MSAARQVRPNRRGVRSRELVLDAAERVMATQGYEAATLVRIVDEAGIPMSSVYHYFESKDGILLAVMERGAGRFFSDLPAARRRLGRPAEHLRAMTTALADALERHPSFLRLLIVFATQPRIGREDRVQAVVARVRAQALARLREQIALAFGDGPDGEITGRLAQFALAAIDGAFVARQADDGVTLDELLRPLAGSLAAIRREMLRRRS